MKRIALPSPYGLPHWRQRLRARFQQQLQGKFPLYPRAIEQYHEAKETLLVLKDCLCEAIDEKTGATAIIEELQAENERLTQQIINKIAAEKSLENTLIVSEQAIRSLMSELTAAQARNEVLRLQVRSLEEKQALNSNLNRLVATTYPHRPSADGDLRSCILN